METCVGKSNQFVAIRRELDILSMLMYTYVQNGGGVI